MCSGSRIARMRTVSRTCCTSVSPRLPSERLSPSPARMSRCAAATGTTTDNVILLLLVLVLLLLLPLILLLLPLLVLLLLLPLLLLLLPLLLLLLLLLPLQIVLKYYDYYYCGYYKIISLLKCCCICCFCAHYCCCYCLCCYLCCLLLLHPKVDGKYVCYYQQPGEFAPLSLTCSVGTCLYEVRGDREERGVSRTAGANYHVSVFGPNRQAPCCLVVLVCRCCWCRC